MSDGKHIIEWGHDYYGRPMLTCSVGGVTVGVKAEFGLCHPVHAALEATQKEYYVVIEKREVPISWRTVDDPLVAIALFYAMIAEMKRAQL